MAYVSNNQDPFKAIADPSRRLMLDAMLGGSRTVGQLRDLLGVSQPAVSQHLKVLQLAGLVELKQEGRTTVCTAKTVELKSVFDWLEKYEVFWNQKLDALEAHLKKGTQ